MTGGLRLFTVKGTLVHCSPGPYESKRWVVSTTLTTPNRPPTVLWPSAGFFTPGKRSAAKRWERATLG